MAEPKKGLEFAILSEGMALRVETKEDGLIGNIFMNGTFCHMGGSSYALSSEELLAISKKCTEVKEAIAKLTE